MFFAFSLCCFLDFNPTLFETFAANVIQQGDNTFSFPKEVRLLQCESLTIRFSLLRKICCLLQRKISLLNLRNLFAVSHIWEFDTLLWESSSQNRKCFHARKRCCFLFPLDNLLDVVELVEGFEGGEVVDINAQYLITYLAEDGVVELEEVHLEALTVLCDSLHGL